MYLLGITNGETASACLVRNGKLISAVSEERFTRIKMDSSWPSKSIDYVLKNEGIEFKDLDKVCYSWSKGFDGDELLLSYFDRIIYEAKNNPNGISLFRDRIKVEIQRDKIKRIEYFNFIKKNNLEKKSYIVNHHKGHMFSALSFSNFKDSLVITADGRGDFESLTVSFYKNNKIKKVYSATSNDSLGTFYARISKLLGFIPHRHEGKVTGLSAHGNYKKCIHLMKKMIMFKDGKLYGINGPFYKSFHQDHGQFKAWSQKALKEFKNFSKKDIAAAAQKHLENIILKIIRYYQKKNKSKNICLAGGVFANVLVNQKIKELKNIKNVFIQPQMGDGGLALGAVASYYFEKTNKQIKFDDMYLGPKYDLSKNEILFLEKKYNLTIKKKNIPNLIVESLKKNKVIGLFQGRMEFGPRALCNRSIIYHCFDKEINLSLNQRLDRYEFMPFAPIVADKYCQKAFKNISKKETSGKFMTMTYACTKTMKKNCPAAIHVDGTARPQIITRKNNLLMHKVLLKWKKETNQIGLLNTSFNHHEEPIVCTPEDAIKSFIRNNTDVLIINNFEVIKNDDI
jgi:carbamoyltransferase